MSKYADFFVSHEVHERKVTLRDGKEHTLHFRELPAATWRKFQIHEASQDLEERAGSVAMLISESLCEPDGTPSMSRDEAMTLKPGAMNALFAAILTLNGVGDRKNESESAEKTGSGTSSLSPSAAEA